MYRFRLSAVDNSLVSLEFDAVDASAALNVAHRHGFQHARLEQEGRHVCTIRASNGDDGGFWIIEQPDNGFSRVRGAGCKDETLV
ncbi:MAG TPA: hypothetical protein VGE05_14545 [Novosphingobium sp.]